MTSPDVYVHGHVHVDVDVYGADSCSFGRSHLSVRVNVNVNVNVNVQNRLHAAVHRCVGILSSQYGRQKGREAVWRKIVLRVLNFAQAPPAISDDVCVGNGGRHGELIVTPHHEVTFVLVLGLSVPVEDVSAGPDERSDRKIAPGFLTQFASRSILEAFTRVQAAAGRQPPSMATRV